MRAFRGYAKPQFLAGGRISRRNSLRRTLRHASYLNAREGREAIASLALSYRYLVLYGRTRACSSRGRIRREARTSLGLRICAAPAECS